MVHSVHFPDLMYSTLALFSPFAPICLCCLGILNWAEQGEWDVDNGWAAAMAEWRSSS